jgi:hypothetical protein
MEGITLRTVDSPPPLHKDTEGWAGDPQDSRYPHCPVSGRHIGLWGYTLRSDEKPLVNLPEVDRTGVRDQPQEIAIHPHAGNRFPGVQAKHHDVEDQRTASKDQVNKGRLPKDFAGQDHDPKKISRITGPHELCSIGDQIHQNTIAMAPTTVKRETKKPKVVGQSLRTLATSRRRTQMVARIPKRASIRIHSAERDSRKGALDRPNRRIGIWMGPRIAMAAESRFLLRRRRKQALVELARIIRGNKSRRKSKKGSAGIIVADRDRQHDHTRRYKESRIKRINSSAETRERVIQPRRSGEYPVISVAHPRENEHPSGRALETAAPVGLQSEEDDVSKDPDVVPLEADNGSVRFGLHSAADGLLLACVGRIRPVVADNRSVRVPTSVSPQQIISGGFCETPNQAYSRNP